MVTPGWWRWSKLIGCCHPGASLCVLSLGTRLRPNDRHHRGAHGHGSGSGARQGTICHGPAIPAVPTTSCAGFRRRRQATAWTTVMVVAIVAAAAASHHLPFPGCEKRSRRLHGRGTFVGIIQGRRRPRIKRRRRRPVLLPSKVVFHNVIVVLVVLDFFLLMAGARVSQAAVAV